MHAVLKQETASLHRQLSTLPNARVLMTKRLTVPQYGQILLAFARAYGHVERELAQLEQTAELGCLPPYTPRLPALRKDILSLGQQDPPEPATVTAPLEASLSAHYFGLRYAIEGSTQGGKYIEKRLRRNFPHLAAETFAFWNVQRAAASQWPSLCETIDELGQSRDRCQEMTAAAKSAFRLFIECLSTTRRAS